MTGKISEDPDRVVNGTEKFAAAAGGSNFGILVSSIATYLASLAQTLTNKTINAANNTISGLTTAMFAANVVDTDSTFAANSDTRIPSQRAVKTATDALSGSLSGKADTSSLAAVATSGNYSDLSGTPTLGALAAKDDVGIADIDATGTPSSSTYLRGDGSWQTPAGGGGGGGREILSADRTYYVRTDGSDSNDGLADSSGGAFLTVQKAIDVVSGSIDLAEHNVVIQIGDGTYASSDPVALKDYVGAGTVILQGNLTTPTNVVLDVTASSGVSAVGVRSGWSISSFQIKNNTASAFLLNVQATFLKCTNICYHANSTSQIHIYCGFGAVINYSGALSQIIGGGTAHIFLDGGSQFYQGSTSVTTISGTPAFSTAFAYASLASGLRAGPATYSGSATGKRYQVQLCAVIDAAGSGANYFPGNSEGTTATGGQYA